MNRIRIIICMVMAMTCALYAHGEDFGQDKTVNEIHQNDNLELSGKTDAEYIPYLFLKTYKPGEVAERLGSKIKMVCTLVVEGYMNKADIDNLRKYSAYSEGNLRALLMPNVKFENNAIPDSAFFVNKGQELISEILYVELPEGLERIGERAFASNSSAYINYVNIPSTIKYIGEGAFAHSQCLSSDVTPLILPEGLEVIEDNTFRDSWLTRNVILPSTLKEIGSYAFAYSGIPSITIPEGVVSIGSNAFNESKLKEIVLPESLMYLSAYALTNNELEELTLPSSITRLGSLGNSPKLKKINFLCSLSYIPDGCFSGAPNLEEIVISSPITKIGSNAFINNKFTTLTVPEGVTEICRSAYAHSPALTTLSLPSTLQYLYTYSFVDAPNLKILFSKAAIPPSNPQNWSEKEIPWGNTPNDIPVYVPEGSAEAYRNSPSWNYFTNFIEIDFGSSDVNEILSDYLMKDHLGDSRMFDLGGREIANPDHGQIYIQNGKKQVNLGR